MTGKPTMVIMLRRQDSLNMNTHMPTTTDQPSQPEYEYANY